VSPASASVFRLILAQPASEATPIARKTSTELIDAVEGGTAAETVSFALDGVAYEIDLSEKNAGTLREELAGWVDKARRVGGRRHRGTGSGSRSGSSGESARIREWARGQGYEVSQRGRVAAHIRRAYEEAHGQ